ncbi:unannotated protein [freshwater metagenome]|uniref:Unannotated protein n=1 Tax=freshwater metagenome TaxID=449393 RepID=A0A6J7DQT9_9ZZZZ|nr:TIGR00730 family Rossman fold protein [Actinomycetota bacterium]
MSEVASPEIKICVYCGTNTGTSPAYMQIAHDLGTTMAQRGLGLVYGGGKLGLMGAVADAVLGAGGHVIGVIPEVLVRAEVGHTGLSQLEVAEDMHTRKARMAELADAFIALPGGFGTFEELLEVLTWNQLGFISKPVVMLDVDGFYAPMLEMFQHAVSAGFVRAEHAALAQRATTVEQALAFATAPAPPTVSKWDGRGADS